MTNQDISIAEIRAAKKRSDIADKVRKKTARRLAALGKYRIENPTPAQKRIFTLLGAIQTREDGGLSGVRYEDLVVQFIHVALDLVTELAMMVKVLEQEKLELETDNKRLKNRR